MTEKRKGVVYTRRWVADWMLDMVGYRSENDIGRRLIVEPSCGCGAFLLPIVERLCGWKARHPDVGWAALSESIRAFDVDEATLRETRRVVRQALIERGCPPETAETLLDAWLVCGDFLLHDTDLRTDFVVGNPPYIRATDMPAEKRKAYAALLECVTLGTDIFVGFYEKSLELLRPGGALCFICADRWLQNGYGKRLRGKVNADFNLDLLVRMHEVRAFDEDVDAYPAITLIRNEARRETFRFVNCSPAFGADDVEDVERAMDGGLDNVRGSRFELIRLEKPHGDALYPLADAATVRFVMSAMGRYQPIEKCGVAIGIGIATGCDDVFLTEDATLVEASRLLPLYHQRFKDARPVFLVNPWEEDGSLADLQRHPRLRNYFEKHADRLKRRYVARKSPEAWYRTIDKIQTELLGRRLILLPDLGVEAKPVITDRYPHHGCYWIASDEWDLEALAGLLMSTPVRRFIDAFGVKMRGGTLRFQAQYLRYVHLPEWKDVPDEVREGLRTAFRRGDAALADRWTERAYRP